ncbi:MAG: GNAT family N-acetyltransferase [Aliishimia sp.]
MTWTIEETRDLVICHDLRRVVFIDEQNVPAEEEVDGLDDTAVHLLAQVNGQPVGTARIVVQNDNAKIGRVCVLKNQRGTGLGAALVDAAVGAAKSRNAKQALLGAQLHALGFYEQLGFEAFGPIFDDAGIDHRMMRKGL